MWGSACAQEEELSSWTGCVAGDPRLMPPTNLAIDPVPSPSPEHALADSDCRSGAAVFGEWSLIDVGLIRG
jgi:hypothetical protein